MSYKSDPSAIATGGRVAVVMGGWSGEHEVSLSSGSAVAGALAERGYDVVSIVIPQTRDRSALDLLSAMQRANVEAAFLALHGRLGEDGCVQGMLELAGIPYTGAGVMASALAMDKVKSKELFLLHNVPTPPYYQVSIEEELADIETIHGHFGFPVIVKPRGEGSSIAVTKAHNLSELVRGLEQVFAIDDYALIERFVDGAEVNVAILDGQVLGAIEVCPKNGIYDYESKYTPGASEYHMPARLQAARYQGVLNLAKRAAEALDVAGAVRVDMLVTAGENEYVLEVNTLPGLTETSLLPKIAASAGYDFGDLCERILQGARLHTPCRNEDREMRVSGTVLRRGVLIADDAAVDTDAIVADVG
jgi:D-alanine-D-alanine ligase